MFAKSSIKKNKYKSQPKINLNGLARHCRRSVGICYRGSTVPGRNFWKFWVIAGKVFRNISIIDIISNWLTQDIKNIKDP